MPSLQLLCRAAMVQNRTTQQPWSPRFLAVHGPRPHAVIGGMVPGLFRATRGSGSTLLVAGSRRSDGSLVKIQAQPWADHQPGKLTHTDSTTQPRSRKSRPLTEFADGVGDLWPCPGRTRLSGAAETFPGRCLVGSIENRLRVGLHADPSRRGHARHCADSMNRDLLLGAFACPCPGRHNLTQCHRRALVGPCRVGGPVLR